MEYSLLPPAERALTARDPLGPGPAERALRESEAYFRSLVENAHDVIHVINADGTTRYLTPSVTRLLGWDPEELIGRPAAELVHPEDLPHVLGGIKEDRGRRGGRWMEFRVPHKDGSWRVFEAVSTNLLDDPGVRGIIINSRDVTERSQAEVRLRHAAWHDALTGLPNRHHFLERLEERIARTAGEPFAVLFLDLDRFKLVNDSLGHHAGDELLIEVGRRLRASARAQDMVARFGGDEFAVLLDRVSGAEEAMGAARRLAGAVSVPVAVGGYEVFTGASVGIALGEPGSTRPEILLRNADMAMYRAKASGAAPRCAVFDRAMHHAAMARLETETDLRRAAERGELLLHYQPIVSLGSGAVEGVEALLRWNHPRRGLVSPAEFVPVAEETGTIVPIGDWVLCEACRQLAEWRAEIPGARVAVTVNLSARQFSGDGLVERVAAAVEMAGLLPRHLKLEITESAIMENTETARAMLHELKALGIRTYMDDFGTGYSSLSSLHRLPIDGLKVDRSFVGRLGTEPSTLALVRAIAGLARGLGLALIAEGVETEAQLAEVRALGCDYAQGFLLSRPLPPEGIARLLAGGLEGGKSAA